MENGLGTDEVMGAITTTHLVLIVLFAILVILAIWWGVTRRRERRRAEELARERREEAAAPAATEPPVAPPPPPLADVPIPASAPQEANPAALAVDEDTAPAPVPAASPAPAPASTALGDGKVTMIKGLGPKVAARLAEHGITRVDQLAALSDDEAASLDAKLGNFSGRMARDRWIEQARLLAAGDRAGFEATFGKLG